ncbi:MAG: antiterminator LoaP [Termitinemataceae bacterium]|nr:MAG: antiterminator LoaP [Termitinemataceae bacterium]
MKYYAIQVKTRSEEKFIKIFQCEHPEVAAAMYFPKREVIEKRMGKKEHKILPVFPGYLFIEIADDVDIHQYHWTFRKTDGFFRFLKSNQNISRFSGHDLEIILHFIKRPSSLAGISKVFFNENDRIVVVSGAMAGFEGKIVKINKRKGRAKVNLDLCGENFAFDLSFETIETRGDHYGK